MEPIEETLPPAEWTRRVSTDDRLEYERENDGEDRAFRYVMQAVREVRYDSPAGTDPEWELRLVKSMRELTDSSTFGRASDRPTALRALFEAMRSINGAESRSSGRRLSHVDLVERLRTETIPR